MHKVVISGLGLITPLGKTWQCFSKRILAGDGAIAESIFTFEGLPNIIAPTAKIENFDVKCDLKNFKISAWDRATQLSVYAARQALVSAELDGKDIEGVIIGVSTNSVEGLDESYLRIMRGNGRIPPLSIPKSMPNAHAAAVCIDLGIYGSSYTVASACSSANQAIINGAQQIRSGRSKRMLCGATESGLSYSNMAAWNGMGVVANDYCRPFCKTRTGLVLGEGSVYFVLEERKSAERRGATILAELNGWGGSSDAMSVTTPRLDGIILALNEVLLDCGFDADDIDYINAHGTATQLNDKIESTAILKALGPSARKIPVSSTKSQHGHLLGASGGIELAATIAAIESNIVPPTINVVKQDEEIGIFVVTNSPINQRIRHALSASYAFGGHNTILAISSPT